jgi:hypothetical protein
VFMWQTILCRMLQGHSRHIYPYTEWSKSLCAPDENSACSINPHTVDDLKMVITEYIKNVERAILNTVFENSSACQ